MRQEDEEKTSETEKKRAFDPWRDRSSRQKPDAIVREGVAVEVYPRSTS